MVAIVAEMTPGAQKENLVSEVVVVIRLSFTKIAGDGCSAALLNHLLYWIGRKALNSPLQQNGVVDLERVSFWKTQDELVEALSNTWTKWKVRQSLDTLLKAGLIGQTDSGTSDRTKRYQFTEKQGQAMKDAALKAGICLRHLDLPSEIRHLLKAAKAIAETTQCNCCIQKMQLLDTNGCNTKIYNKDLQQRETENDVAASQRNDTLSLPEIKQTELSTGCVSGVDNSQHLIADSPTPEQSSLFPIASQSSSHKETEGAKQAMGKKERKQPSTILTLEQEDRARSWRKQLQEKRQHNTLATGVLIQESKDLRKLVRDYSDEQIAGCLARQLSNPFSRWSKEENRFKLTASVLWQEMGPYLANLESVPSKPARQRSSKPQWTEEFNAEEFEKEFYPTEAQKRLHREKQAAF